MGKYYDVNGVKVECGMDVEMPEPMSNDIWFVGGFIGMVEDVLGGGNLIVSDQDGDFYEVEANRVEVV